MVSCLTGLSSILVYFCVWCKKVVQLHSSACQCPVLRAPFAKDTVFFFHWILFLALSKISWLYICGSMSGLPILFHLSVSVFVPAPYCLNDYSFVIEVKVWDCDASCFGFLFQNYFGYSGSFVVPYKF